jgi:hypothetical protein
LSVTARAKLSNDLGPGGADAGPGLGVDQGQRHLDLQGAESGDI